MCAVPWRKREVNNSSSCFDDSYGSVKALHSNLGLHAHVWQLPATWVKLFRSALHALLMLSCWLCSSLFILLYQALLAESIQPCSKSCDWGTRAANHHNLHMKVPWLRAQGKSLRRMRFRYFGLGIFRPSQVTPKQRNATFSCLAGGLLPAWNWLRTWCTRLHTTYDRDI